MKYDSKLKLDIIKHTNHNYSNTSIRKKSGGRRAITALSTNASDRTFILGTAAQINKLQTHPRAIAYVKGKDYKPEVAKHAKFKYHYKFDFTDFFGSFTIHKLFELGIPNMFSRREFITLVTAHRKQDSNRYLGRTAQYEYKLGQGAPASPALTNMMMKPFDTTFNNQLNSLVPDKSDIIYSRYADDILVSTNYKFPISQIEEQVLRALRDTRLKFLKLNRSKTRMLITGGKSKFLGLTITATNGISTGADHRRTVIKNFRRLENTRSHRIHKYEP